MWKSGGSNPLKSAPTRLNDRPKYIHCPKSESSRLPTPRSKSYSKVFKNCCTLKQKKKGRLVLVPLTSLFKDASQHVPLPINLKNLSIIGYEQFDRLFFFFTAKWILNVVSPFYADKQLFYFHLVPRNCPTNRSHKGISIFFFQVFLSLRMVARNQTCLYSRKDRPKRGRRLKLSCLPPANIPFRWTLPPRLTLKADKRILLRSKCLL